MADDAVHVSLSADELGKGRPSNAWQHSKRRERFKHLLDPAAVRDVSFLYDTTARQPGLPPLDGDGALSATDNQHLHVASSRAVAAPVVDEDKYAVRVRGEHPVPLPSLVPSGRAEALLVLRSMEERLRAAGVDDEETETGAATPLHALLELVHKEQTIYNTCFGELIRQVRLVSGSAADSRPASSVLSADRPSPPSASATRRCWPGCHTTCAVSMMSW